MRYAKNNKNSINTAVKENIHNYLRGSIKLIYIDKGKRTWIMHYHWKITSSKLLYESSFYAHTSPYNINRNLPEKKTILTWSFLALSFLFPKCSPWTTKKICYNSWQMCILVTTCSFYFIFLTWVTQHCMDILGNQACLSLRARVSTQQSGHAMHHVGEHVLKEKINWLWSDPSTLSEQ